ncbi:MAG: MFS transporter, partial [Acidimicrobiales bacterium]
MSLLTTSHAVQHFYAGGLAVTYPFVVGTFHISYATLGLVLAASGIVGGLLQGAAGLVRRTSARALLAAQNLALAACALAGAAAPGFAGFGAARTAGSLAAWPQHPVGSAYLSDRFPSRRGTVLAWHTTGGTIGTLVIPIVTAAMITLWGWRVALAALAAPLALGGLFIYLRLPKEGPLGRGSQVPVGEGEPVGAAPHVAAIRRKEPDPAVGERSAAGEGETADVPIRQLLRRRSVLTTLAAA